jgi:hypothetical protein
VTSSGDFGPLVTTAGAVVSSGTAAGPGEADTQPASKKKTRIGIERKVERGMGISGEMV